MSEAVEPGVSAEMALAIYASTAATAAIVVLREVKVMDANNIRRLVDNLMACRLAANNNPGIEKHLDLLFDLLLPGDDEISPPRA